MDTFNLTEHLLLLALFSGLTIFPWVSSDGNSTATPEARSIPCHMYIENCSDTSEAAKWSGHFSRCPRKYKNYCVKGKCRFVTTWKEPSCRCDKGYTGARCNYVDLFYLKEDRGQLVVIILIITMVTFVIAIISVCICSHHCRKAHRRKMKAKEIERLNNDFLVKMEETQIA
ncbi:probetacellulin [Gastrophryne carolinensis]